jgi:hypothetical protein
MKDTAELPIVDDTMPTTPRPRRVPSETADPAWVAAMDRLSRISCEAEEKTEET